VHTQWDAQTHVDQTAKGKAIKLWKTKQWLSRPAKTHGFAKSFGSIAASKRVVLAAS
jgi:hypothetical protein